MATTFLFGPPAPAPWDKSSQEFMEQDLWRSKLLPSDLAAWPIVSTKYGAPAYVIPYTGNPNGLYRIRINRAENKYLATQNVAPDLWIPPDTDMMEMYDGPLWIIEGEKKAASAYKHWGLQNVVAIGGCWNATMKSKDSDVYSLIPSLQHLCTAGRTINLVLDGDVIENKHVGKAASTLHALIAAMNCELILFRPPPQWKGVDDWINEDPTARPQDLELVPFSKLSINRTILYDQLECHLNEKGGLIHNELNGSKLLGHYFKSEGVVNDKRLGFIGRDKRQMSPDRMHLMALKYLQGDISPRYPAGSIAGAFSAYQVEGQSYDLVQAFVRDTIKWDGVPRLDYTGHEYFETNMPKVADEWLRLLFTGMTMRILEPGAKVDTVCILNGPQGIGKTTFFEDLATIDGFSFYRPITDLPGSTGDDRTFKQTITAALVVDLGEGIIFESRKTSSDRLKQFLTERTDEYRVAYAKQNTIVPRGYVFVGTTNRGDQLSDYTGSRRFLYLNVKSIKRMDYAIKLQILAEAAARMDEIKDTPWYDLRVKLEDLPQELRDENAHIKTVQELLNVEHYRPDALAEAIQQMVESDGQATFKASGDVVLSANYIAAMMQNQYAPDRISRKITELSGSPQFPYKFEARRHRLQQITFHSTMQEALYSGFINNAQGMFSCYIVTRK